MTEDKGHSGGCQCGAVRFRVHGALGRASICHCRMCQKATGGFFAPLVAVSRDQIEWTRGERTLFRSSNHVSRGFCASCGTPLTYEEPGETMALSIGAFDHPERIPPSIQYGIERVLPYVDTLAGLPGRETLQDLEEASFLSDIRSFQHPDEDTETWPPEEGRSHT
ncbi:MAG: aldehyde-activating protein [Stappia sp.]|uniref:GFA family protein n=1 Tax=Stappia sp. TaxID=1870903 RepID=UPI000C39165B|nr:GFA family protein [Stappia sp.]MAA98314.1 aldehyde-activating protein [Stappia sp.]MBM20867.1 aldehyde-activating protein [Stappia sp.]|tara:strand:- start:503 stop:1000 length:498 start_codon:yes stop_codon:yes gene_type:complete